MADEEWRSVEGFKNIYEISSLGRLRRIRASKASPAGKILSCELTGAGYRIVRLCDNGRQDRRLLHHIVLRAFVGPRPIGLETNHKDGNGQNNRVDNLEYLTRKANALHARRVLKKQIGADHPMAKLTESDVQAIRASALAQRPLARKYGVTQPTIQRIKVGRSWRSLAT